VTTSHHEAPATSPAGASALANPSSGRPLDPRSARGWLFAIVWLIYLVPTFQAAWEEHTGARRLIGCLVVVVFAALYVQTFYWVRAYRWTGARPMTSALRWGVLLLEAVLTVVACLIVGQEGTAFVVYLAVMIVLVLPTRPALVTVALLGLATFLSTRYLPGWKEDDGLVFSTFLATLAIWGITQMITRNRELAEAQEEIAELAVAQERTRFSRDLHDLLGHSLTVITMKTELAGRLVSLDPQRAEREIADVERLARDALADVRAAVAGYRPVTLTTELASARAALETAGIVADLPVAVDDVPGERRELFGWAVREGVTNVVRHSGARHCRVTLSPAGVEIVDDGRGPTGSAPGGNGLLGLRERADAVGARVTVGRAPDGDGFRLRVGW
jgi:two-component system, NarL family, sensor histidine kinase DesK